MDYLTQRPGETAHEYAQRYFLYQITNPNFEPGQKISDMEVPKELNISRTPVREVILSFTNRQLTESYPQRGTFVSLINSEIVEQVCTMRRMTKGSLAEMSCGLISRSNLDNLYDTITLQKDYVSGDPRENFEKFLSLDIAFHKEFYDIRSMPFTYDTMQNVIPYFDRQRKLSYHIAISDRVISEHLVTRKALENWDTKEAGKAMVEHTSTALVDQNILKKKFPDYSL